MPMDIYDDTLARVHLPSGAAMLAKEFGGSTVFGGFFMIDYQYSVDSLMYMASSSVRK